MKHKLFPIVVSFFVFGSAVISSIDSISFKFKLIFYMCALTILIITGLVSLYRFVERTKH